MSGHAQDPSTGSSPIPQLNPDPLFLHLRGHIEYLEQSALGISVVLKVIEDDESACLLLMIQERIERGLENLCREIARVKYNPTLVGEIQ